MVRKAFLLALLLLLSWNTVDAQYLYYDYYRPMKDTLRLQRMEPHLSVTTGFIGNSWGDNRIFTSVAPSVTYRVSDKVTLEGGFGVVMDMGLDRNYASAPGRSKAPRRASNGGTGLVSAEVAMHYQVNDRLQLSAWLYHVGGQYAPFYSRMSDGPLDVSVTALSASAAYRFNEQDYLHVSFTMIRDHAGTAPFLMHDAWMSRGWGGWDTGWWY